MSSDTKINLVASAESSHLILKNVSVLSELSSQLKRETKKGENSLESLQSLLFQAGKNVSSLNKCVETLLAIARKLVYQSLKIVPVADPNFQSLKTEADKLLNILDEIQNDEDEQSLDVKWRQIDRSLKMNLSSKSLNICEKYPEHCSKESLLDISSISTLPTLHEDVFVNFHKPNKTLSSCSLKNLRRMKKCLQKVPNDDYESENETENTDATPPQSTAKFQVDCGCSPDKVCLPLMVSTGTNPIQVLDNIQTELN